MNSVCSQSYVEAPRRDEYWNWRVPDSHFVRISSSGNDSSIFIKSLRWSQPNTSVSFYMKRLRRLKEEITGIFLEVKQDSTTYHQYVEALYFQFVKAIANGESVSYLDPFLEPLNSAQKTVHKIEHYVRNVSGVSSHLAECKVFEANLDAAISAVEELQLRYLEGGLDLLERDFANHTLRFQRSKATP